MLKLAGKPLVAEIETDLALQVETLKAQKIQPCLAVIIVGDDPASHVYVRHKKLACERLGLLSIEHKLASDTSEEELFGLIGKLNADPKVHGILCQLPLPQAKIEEGVVRRIAPSKDVDCFHPENLGLLTAGIPRFLPCTPHGVIQILKRYDIQTSGKEVAIVGRSNIVGRPLSILLSLKGYDSTVTLCHSRTKDLEEVCRRADILVAAIGRPNFITNSHLKKDAVVIDVGINRIEDPSHPKGTRLVGDVDGASIVGTASAATPVPGGVGPLTIAMLMYNTINAARLQNNMELFEL